MLYTTLNEIYEKGPWAETYKKAIVKALNKESPDDDPLPFDFILEKLGIGPAFNLFSALAGPRHLLGFCERIMELNPDLRYSQLKSIISDYIKYDVCWVDDVDTIMIPRGIFDRPTLKAAYLEAVTHFFNEEYKPLLEDLYSFIFFERTAVESGKAVVDKLDDDIRKLMADFIKEED